MRKPTLSDLFYNVYFHTMESVIDDLSKQVIEIEGCIKRKAYCYGEKEDQEHVDLWLALIKEAIFYYFGEGGIGLNGHRYEKFVKKHFPDMVYYGQTGKPRQYGKL